MTRMPEHEALYRAALDADDAWFEELVMRYGKRAGDARYDERGKNTARLEELWRAKRAADKALQIALQGSRTRSADSQCACSGTLIHVAVTPAYLQPKCYCECHA